MQDDISFINQFCSALMSVSIDSIFPPLPKYLDFSKNIGNMHLFCMFVVIFNMADLLLDPSLCLSLSL